MPLPIILDTDIGTDVDDCLALALLLGSPEAELVGVTTVYGDVLLRSRMVLKLLRLHGRTAPVAAGASAPIQALGPVYWEGHEGEGLLTIDDLALQPAPLHAADFLVESVLARPGEISLLAIGPLTNVALALFKEPRLATHVKGITVMGGVVGGRGQLHLPWVEHNFQCDPAAARVVLASGAPVRIVPLDVTTQVVIRPSDVARLAGLNTPFHCAIAEQVARYPRYQQQGWTYLHDPLAAAALLVPELLQWTPVHALLETGGEYSAGRLIVRTPDAGAAPNAEIALEVAAPVAHDFIVDRLLAPVQRDN